jgi:hypothetical protein
LKLDVTRAYDYVGMTARKADGALQPSQEESRETDEADESGVVARQWAYEIVVDRFVSDEFGVGSCGTGTDD